MAKVKTTLNKETPEKDDGTITREEAKTPKAPPLHRRLKLVM